MAFACQGDTLSLQSYLISGIKANCDYKSWKYVNVKFQNGVKATGAFLTFKQGL